MRAERGSKGTEVAGRKTSHDLILVQVARRDRREGRAAFGKGLAIGFCISAGRFRPALPRVDGAASTVAPDSAQPAGAVRGGVLVSHSRREAAETADFCRRHGRSAPDAWEVAKSGFPVRRQHCCAVVGGRANRLELAAVMDDH